MGKLDLHGVKEDTLRFSFPEVHPLAFLDVALQRTLRIPDDGKNYPFPPGLGNFPVRRVDDFADRVPKEWVEHGGLIMPMYQSEAMWVAFTSGYVANRQQSYPFAVKISTGKVSALTGKKWKAGLRPKDYCVAPSPQKWIDGFMKDEGVISQFVAAPLGAGYSVEEQVTDKAEHGGLQIQVFPMKWAAFKKRFQKIKVQQQRMRSRGGPPIGSKGGGVNYSSPGIYTMDHAPTKGGMHTNSTKGAPRSRGIEETTCSTSFSSSSPFMESSLRSLNAMEQEFAPMNMVQDMSLAAGGSMVQEIYADPFDINDWDTSAPVRCFLHLANSMVWETLTGQLPPYPPHTAATYAARGLPWYDYYVEDSPSLGAAKRLDGVKTVAELDAEKAGAPVLPENTSAMIAKHQVKKIPRTASPRSGADWWGK
jgi:hypothetical protein